MSLVSEVLGLLTVFLLGALFGSVLTKYKRNHRSQRAEPE